MGQQAALRRLGRRCSGQPTKWPSVTVCSEASRRERERKRALRAFVRILTHIDEPPSSALGSPPLADRPLGPMLASRNRTATSLVSLNRASALINESPDSRSFLRERRQVLSSHACPLRRYW